MSHITDAKRSGGTLCTYEVPCRLLKEVLGEKTPVASVTKERLEHLLKRPSPNRPDLWKALSRSDELLKCFDDILETRSKPSFAAGSGLIFGAAFFPA